MPKEILVASIRVGSTLEQSLYSASGELLLLRGKSFTAERLAAFTDAGFQKVYAAGAGENDTTCGENLRCEVKDILAVRPDEVLAHAVTDETGRVLLQEGFTVSTQYRDTLLRKGVHQVVIRRSLEGDVTRKITRKLRSRLSEIAQSERMSGFGRVFVSASVKPERMVNFDQSGGVTTIERLEASENDRAISLDKMTRRLVESARLSAEDNRDDATRIVALRARAIAKIQALFARITAGERVDGRVVEDMAKSAVFTLVSDPYHRLYLGADPEGTDYLASHSLNTLILSVNIAARLDYAASEILELCYGALLHDIGMLRIPLSIRRKTQPLTEAERRTIERHPALGMELLGLIRNTPASAALVVAQENERLDGSGYPRAAKAKKLHPFTRIVQVAAAYDAMTQCRPFAPQQHPYHAMAEMLAQTYKGKFDSNVMRALLETLSLFPIGSGVQLTDGRAGYTLDASGREYTRPVVLVDRDHEGRALGSTLIVDMQDMANAQLKIIGAVAPYLRAINVDVASIEEFSL